MYKKILVPLDGSERAEAILPHARSLADHASTEIVLLRVPSHPSSDYLVSDPQLMASLYELIVSEAESYVQGIAAKLRADGFEATTEVEYGLVADTILDYAQRAHVDLIAMSTHGRSGLTRWVLGSVADKVVRASCVPVLLVRPPVTDTAPRGA